MKAMIFAAGLGTRLRPLTNNKPKALVEIEGITLLERCISNLKKYDINNIIINIHHYGEQIIDFLEKNNNFGVNIHISDEREALLNTGGAILYAKDLLADNDPIIIINVDILTNINFTELIKYHKNNTALATLIVKNRESSRQLLFNDNKLVGWENIKTGEIKFSGNKLVNNPTKHAFSGIQVIDQSLLNKITEKGSFSIIDMYLRLANSEKICSYLDKSTIWMDLGKIDDINKANILIKTMQ